MPKAAAVSESHSSFDAYAVVPRAADRPAGDWCSVAFWNLTGRDLTVQVEGQDHYVPRGKNVRLDLGRQFVWRVEDRAAETEKVPANDSAVEIVIRR
jgi:hypothetical protein